MICEGLRHSGNRAKGFGNIFRISLGYGFGAHTECMGGYRLVSAHLNLLGTPECHGSEGRQNNKALANSVSFFLVFLCGCLFPLTSQFSEGRCLRNEAKIASVGSQAEVCFAFGFVPAAQSGYLDSKLRSIWAKNLRTSTKKPSFCILLGSMCTGLWVRIDSSAQGFVWRFEFGVSGLFRIATELA